MRRLLPALILVAAILLWWGWCTEPTHQRAVLTESTQSTSNVPAPSGDEAATTEAIVEPVIRPDPPAHASPSTFEEARAYRMVLDGDQCTMQAVDELRGDFSVPRKLRRLAGMFNCRLVDDHGRLLAETTMEAPDMICVVLDPNIPDSSGGPTPATLTATGPVTFQARLPKVNDATALEVIRLEGSVEPSGDSRPLGQLIASLPLTP